MTPPLSRRKAIEAAIAAHNRADRMTLLPPIAAQLLIVMFRGSDVCQHSMLELEAEGFDGRTVQHLLRALVDAGLLSKERRRGATSTYRLHLPRGRR